jgi:hypothetical protein
MPECPGVSGAPDRKGPTTRSGPICSTPGARTTTLAHKNSLFCRSCFDTAQPAATNMFILKFRAMLRWRSAKKLDPWIKAAASEFRLTAQFARALRRDLQCP